MDFDINLKSKHRHRRQGIGDPKEDGGKSINNKVGEIIFQARWNPNLIAGDRRS